MRWLCVGLVCLYASGAAAQKDSMYSSRLHFTGMAAGNLLLGDARYGYAAKLAAGAGFKRWQVGVGAGYDHYSLRTYPLFLTAGADVLRRWRVMVEGGINLPEQRLLSSTPWSATRLHNGRYSAGFVHYRLHAWQKKILFAGLGYSRKSLKQEERGSGGWPFTTETHYRLSRIALQLSFSF